MTIQAIPDLPVNFRIVDQKTALVGLADGSQELVAVDSTRWRDAAGMVKSLALGRLGPLKPASWRELRKREANWVVFDHRVPLNARVEAATSRLMFWFGRSVDIAVGAGFAGQHPLFDEFVALQRPISFTSDITRRLRRKYGSAKGVLLEPGCAWSPAAVPTLAWDFATYRVVPFWTPERFEG